MDLISYRNNPSEEGLKAVSRDFNNMMKEAYNRAWNETVHTLREKLNNKIDMYKNQANSLEQELSGYLELETEYRECRSQLDNNRIILREVTSVISSIARHKLKRIIVPEELISLEQRISTDVNELQSKLNDYHRKCEGIGKFMELDRVKEKISSLSNHDIQYDIDRDEFEARLSQLFPSYKNMAQLIIEEYDALDGVDVTEGRSLVHGKLCCDIIDLVSDTDYLIYQKVKYVDRFTYEDEVIENRGTHYRLYPLD